MKLNDSEGSASQPDKHLGLRNMVNAMFYEQKTAGVSLGYFSIAYKYPGSLGPSNLTGLKLMGFLQRRRLYLTSYHSDSVHWCITRNIKTTIKGDMQLYFHFA